MQEINDFKSHNRGSTFMFGELPPYLVFFTGWKWLNLGDNLIFLLKLENTSFPHFPLCTSPQSNFQLIWTKLILHLLRSCVLNYIELSTPDVKSFCTMYNTQEEVTLSQKTVSTAFDTPDINPVHTVVK